jgi:5-methylcytosine-specific restriction protein A
MRYRRRALPSSRLSLTVPYLEEPAVTQSVGTPAPAKRLIAIETMPTLVPPCSNYPCSNLATYRGRCVQCSASADRSRGTTKQRGYDQRWKDARDFYLSQHPLCEDCVAEGFFDRAAREVHHKLALRLGGARLDPENFRALCKSCHSKRTARGE